MRGLVLLVILCLAGCADPSKDVLTYTRRLKPGMTASEVQSLFPKNMRWIDEPADEVKENCWMNKRYSSNQVARRLVFSEPEAGWRVTYVYFDTNSTLIGLDMGASSSPVLTETELRFPGELIQCRCGSLHWHRTTEEARICQQGGGHVR